MSKAVLAILFMGAGTIEPVKPTDNIFKARAKIPIIGQAITEFQDICLTFMLHESAVSKSEDVKHFDAIIKASGYESVYLDPHAEGRNMGLWGRSFFESYKKENGDVRLGLRWRQPYDHFYINSFSEREREAVLNTPYGKFNGLSCSVSVQLPKHIDLSNIKAEILDHDEDWETPPKAEISTRGISSMFPTVRLILSSYHQDVYFEESSFTFKIDFIDPSTMPKTTDSKNPIEFLERYPTPVLTLSMKRP